ncbi:hypothetical protein NDI76_18255 [Halogeometricum sp. S1BR25-6]|uniref:Uncharacterized protein n=1 Tax=Halogeometricum salsisoli TaxID=2950536 RepID=A0ABU2GIT9_9EURY|nr:hypothetical protein [Halogeometricum sp. S1BR25-6]MDS0300695.1 hypothetical protein [Halogeometricum sp. S1BR25-6]
MADRHRANYALLPVLEQLGPNEGALDVPWATFAGDRTSEYEFTVPTERTADPYVELQAYDVGTYGHEILLNGDSLAGFDVPPAEGWQFWMDTVSGSELREGVNTVRIRRDASEDDSFAVGNVVVHWKEPIE